MRCPPWCGKDNRNEKAREKKEEVRRRETRKVEEEKAISWAEDEKEDWRREKEMKINHHKIETIVPKQFYQWLKVFGKVESERMLVQKVWDHVIDVKEDFKPSKAKVYPLSRNKREEVQNLLISILRRAT